MEWQDVRVKCVESQMDETDDNRESGLCKTPTRYCPTVGSLEWKVVRSTMHTQDCEVHSRPSLIILVYSYNSL